MNRPSSDGILLWAFPLSPSLTFLNSSNFSMSSLVFHDVKIMRKKSTVSFDIVDELSSYDMANSTRNNTCQRDHRELLQLQCLRHIREEKESKTDEIA